MSNIQKSPGLESVTRESATREPSAPRTASLLIIGNEILSGRTQDKNLHWLARQFSEMGIRFAEVRVVPDIMEEVVGAVDALRTRYDYLFTTGGIGPTHDDITTACIARAFGVPVTRDARAEQLLRGYYPEGMLNAARLRMADVPQGAELIPNPISAAPGYRMENVFTLAGVPSIMQAMFAQIRDGLQSGPAFHSRSFRVWVGEGNLARLMGGLQEVHPRIDIGSYPFTQGSGVEARIGTSIVLRGTDETAIDTVAEALIQGLWMSGFAYQSE